MYVKGPEWVKISLRLIIFDSLVLGPHDAVKSNEIAK